MNKINTKREQILLLLVKLKHIEMNKIIKLKKQVDYLNGMANEIIISNDKELDMYHSKLNEMSKNENR